LQSASGFFDNQVRQSCKSVRLFIEKRRNDCIISHILQNVPAGQTHLKIEQLISVFLVECSLCSFLLVA
jgi:hypothetical protein